MLCYFNQDEMLPDITRVAGMNLVVVADRQAVIVSLQLIHLLGDIEGSRRSSIFHHLGIDE